MFVRQIHDEKLAQYAYLVGCPATGEAAVIDPERDVDRYLAVAESHGLRVVAAIDTHLHADYLSGLRELAERGVTVYASDEGWPDWRYEWLLASSYPHRLLKHGERFRVGNVELEAVHTPGHTPEHMSYLVRDLGGGATDPIALASGDFVFVGDVGRPDLLETAAGMTGTMRAGARQLFRSVQGFRALPEYLQVWPAHGAGSACGKALGDVPLSTVGYELRHNASIRAAGDEAGFVDFILFGQPEPPPYFARMKRDNRAGPPLLRKFPAPLPLGPGELDALAASPAVVTLDTRRRGAFAAGHLPGSILAELDYQFLAIAGSYVDEGSAINLVVERERLDEAMRALVRIGLDDVVSFVTPAALAEYGALRCTLDSTEEIGMGELEERRLAGGVTILDVRGAAEHAGRHVPGSLNIAHTRLKLRLAEVPRDRPVIVHCNSGGRSAAAASLLAREGYAVVNVNDLVANYRQAEMALAGA